MVPPERRLPPRLLALSQGRAQDARDAESELRRLADLAAAGLRGCVLREPGLEDQLLLELARRLRPSFAPEDGGWLCVHDRVHVALAAQADAVHLGFRSLTPLQARRAIEASGAAPLAIGLSTHASDEPASWVEADYLFHGPVFATPSKAGLVEPVGLAGLERALAARPDPTVPVLALGGIRAPETAAVMATGVAGVAVLAALAGAERPEEVLADLVLQVEGAGRGGVQA